MGFKPFSWNTLAGLLVGALLAVLGHLAGGRAFFINPEYPAYLQARYAHQDWHERREAWDKRHASQHERQAFEETVAGSGSPWAVRDEALRALARDLQAAAGAHAEAPSLERADALQRVLLRAPEFLKEHEWLRCEAGSRPRECQFMGPLATFNDLPATARLLAGDTRTAYRMPALPADLERPPALPAPVAPTLPHPRWFSSAVLALFWIGFAIGYHWLGRMMHRRRDWPDPLRARPTFILGWIVSLAMLPSFVLAQVARLLISDLRPWFAGLRRAFRRRDFAHDYAQLKSELAASQAIAEITNDHKLKSDLRELETRIEAAETLAEINELRKGLYALEDRSKAAKAAGMTRPNG